jgi:transcriptional regulator with GAF, ATPase, and Fis domain
VLARWLHEHGPRAEEPFVDINCAGLSRDLLESELFGHERGSFTGAATSKLGLLEVAHRGTAFLDEIGEIDLALQPRILKVLEEKRFRRVGDVRSHNVDVRLITATNRDLGDSPGDSTAAPPARRHLGARAPGPRSPRHRAPDRHLARRRAGDASVRVARQPA